MSRIIPASVILSVLISTQVYGYEPGDHDLFIMPTAYTMPQGKSYLTDYEVLFLNYTYAPTNSLHIGVFSFIPPFFGYLTLGAKQRLFRNRFVAGAVWVSHTPWIPRIYDDGTSSVTIAGGVASFGTSAISGHLAPLVVPNFKNPDLTGYLCMAGAKLDLKQDLISQKVEFLGECLIPLNDLDYESTVFYYNLGLRVSGKVAAFDGGVMLSEGNIIPLIKGTYYFD